MIGGMITDWNLLKGNADEAIYTMFNIDTYF